jgi:AraC family transcriptional regulator
MHSFGTEVRVCDAGGIRVSETLMPRGLVLEEHSHEAGQLCFVLEGAYRERLPGGERVLGPGMLHVRAPGEPHANRFSREDDALTLLISIDPARWVPAAMQQPVRMLDDVAAEMRREMRRGDDAARAALEGLAMLTLSRVARLAPREPEWLGDAISLVERRFHEPLSLQRVASELGVGRGSLALAFRRYRGTSVGEAIRAARVRHAKALLLTNAPLAEIALAAGFHDQAHFTRVFRAFTGQTPGAWRSLWSGGL